MNEAGSQGPSIICRDLQMHYDQGLVRALDGVDLEVPRGEFLAIMGPSGSGKSTLLHLMGALDVPTAGSIQIMGQDLATVPDIDQLRSRTVGFVFQLHNLIPNLTLRENVAIPMFSRRGISRAQKHERAGELLELVGLGHRADFLPVKVSGGERQRAAIARALVNDPEIILADEPTGSVDAATGERLLELLREVQAERGATLILITHNAELASQADRTIHLLDGRVRHEVMGAGAQQGQPKASASSSVTLPPALPTA